MHRPALRTLRGLFLSGLRGFTPRLAGAALAALLAAAFAAPAFAAPSPAASEDAGRPAWGEWRGPGRDGIDDGAETWPASLDGLEKVWRVELGKGYPGPLVGDGKVFVVESLADESAQVRALDRETGKELWRKAWASSGDVPFFAAKSGDWVRSTPAWDGDTLYVGDMREVLTALDGDTGEERWRVDLPARFGTPVPDFGFVSSPLVDGGAVYVQAATSLVKLDAATGKTLWRALEGETDIMSSGAFSSPVVATLAGVRQIVAQTREALHGVDPDDGTVLWRQAVPNFRGMNILTPTVVGDGIFTSTHQNRSFFYRVSRSPEGTFSVEEVWTNKAQGSMSSPVVIGGHVYLHLANKRLDAIRLSDGESAWRTGAFGEYWSMVARGDRFLALDSDGELLLVEADPAAFRLLDRREVADSPTWGYLAVSGDWLFVRELEAVAAYRLGPGGPGGGSKPPEAEGEAAPKSASGRAAR